MKAIPSSINRRLRVAVASVRRQAGLPGAVSDRQRKQGRNPACSPYDVGRARRANRTGRPAVDAGRPHPFLVAVCGWGLGFYGPSVYPASLRALHEWSTAQLSSVVTLYYLSSATWIVFVGGAIDRVGPRWVVLVGCVALGTGVVLLPWAEAAWHLFPIFLVMSLGWAAMSGAAINAIVARISCSRRSPWPSCLGPGQRSSSTSDVSSSAWASGT